MRLFHHDNRPKSAHAKRFYALTELVYTLVDFTAAMCFLIGSVMFFWQSLYIPAVWLFVIGSACFALKPTIRLWREIKLAAMGDSKDLAQRE